MQDDLLFILMERTEVCLQTEKGVNRERVEDLAERGITDGGSFMRKQEGSCDKCMTIWAVYSPKIIIHPYSTDWGFVPDMLWSVGCE